MLILFYDRNYNLSLWKHCTLQLSVVNDQNEPIEVVQEIDSPAYTSSDCIYWGYTWYMQTPLENIGEGFGLVVRILHDNASSTPVARYHFNKETIDSGAVKISMNTMNGVPPAPIVTQHIEEKGFSAFFSAPKARESTSIVLSPGTSDSVLESDIEITKMFRQVDITEAANAMYTPKDFQYTPIGATPTEALKAISTNQPLSTIVPPKRTVPFAKPTPAAAAPKPTPVSTAPAPVVSGSFNGSASSTLFATVSPRVPTGGVALPAMNQVKPAIITPAPAPTPAPVAEAPLATASTDDPMPAGNGGAPPPKPSRPKPTK